VVSRQALDEYAAANNGIVAMAQRDLADFWRLLDTTNPLEIKAAMLKFMPELVATYGESAALLAADFYAAVRPASLPTSYDPVLADPPPINQVEAVTRHNIGPAFQGDPAAALSNLASATQRLVNQPGRETIAKNVDRDPDGASWARVPVGKTTCTFCRMLASRGAVYGSKASASNKRNGSKYHNDCDCKPVPMWSKADYPEGYDPEALYEEYAQAHEPGMSTKATLAAMRKQDGEFVTAITESSDLSEWDRWNAGRDIDVHSGARPGYQRDNPLEFYGTAVNIADESDVSRAHLEDLELFSESAHNTLRNHFARTPGGGFYVGDKAMPQLDNQGHLAGVKPRGWADGQTWDNVPGGYDPNARVCACGGGGKGHGATSLALHEGSHALDDALARKLGRRASQTQEWQDVFYAMHGSARMNPYFTYEGNQSGFLSEGFAESYAAYTKARAAGRPLDTAITDALGTDRLGKPVMDASRGIIAYFEKIESEAMG
jgi:hypothetical protein